MVSKDEAEAIALAHLRSMETPECPFALVERIERPFGWVLFYQSARFVKTGDFIDQLAGNGPIVVDRHSGRITVLQTSRSIETQIDELQQMYARRHGDA